MCRIKERFFPTGSTVVSYILLVFTAIIGVTIIIIGIFIAVFILVLLEELVLYILLGTCLYKYDSRNS